MELEYFDLPPLYKLDVGLVFLTFGEVGDFGQGVEVSAGQAFQLASG
jgi:hypothetical protein